jgi:four helix bundle protein
VKAEGKNRRDITERTFPYAPRAIRLYQYVIEKGDGAGRVIARQYLRSATAIGANIEEAPAAESRADFVHKYGMAPKEARESLYWLKLLSESALVSKTQLTALIQETDELVAIIPESSSTPRGVPENDFTLHPSPFHKEEFSCEAKQS